MGKPLARSQGRAASIRLLSSQACLSELFNVLAPLFHLLFYTRVGEI